MHASGLANRITLARSAIALVVWTLLAWGTPTPSVALVWTTFVLFVLGAATDFVDGMIARHLQEVSVFGRIVDPLVDKMLTIGTMVVLLGMDGVAEALPPWMVAVMLFRELLVTVMRGQVEGQGGNFQAARIGKWKMIVQCILVGSAILHPLGTTWANTVVPGLSSLPGGDRWTITYSLAWAALVLTAVSLFPYLLRARTVLREQAAASRT